MSNDYRASPLSNDELEEFASSTRRQLCLAVDEAPDLTQILQRGFVPTRFGPKPLDLEIVPDGSLGGDHAQTVAFPRQVTIKVEETVWNDALKRQNRAVMTLAHELGHAVLHEKPVPLGRASPSVETKRPEYLRGYESSEHQAKYFASAFLIPWSAVVLAKTARELALRYNVSAQAAEIRLGQFRSKEPRRVPEATQKIIDEIKANAHRPFNQRVISRIPLSDWDRLPVIKGEDPTEYRQSYSGYRLKKSEFNKINILGWFIEGDRIIAALERHDCS